MSQTVSVRLDEEVIEQLDMMAKAANRSRAWLMAQAIVAGPSLTGTGWVMTADCSVPSHAWANVAWSH